MAESRHWIGGRRMSALRANPGVYETGSRPNREQLSYPQQLPSNRSHTGETIRVNLTLILRPVRGS